MINDLLTNLERITFQQWLGVWLIIFLFMILSKLSSYIDAKVHLMKVRADAERATYENEVFRRRGKDL